MMADAAVEEVLHLLREREALEVTSIADARLRLESFATLIGPVDDVRLQAVRVNGVACEWVCAAGADADGVLMYFHGGGYGLGSIATHRALVSRLSQASGRRALTVGYRLAPEHPFPGAVEDALAAYRGVVALGVTPDRVVLAGDSAGGGLVLATMLALREAGDALPAGGVCLSPWVDLDIGPEPAPANGYRDPMVTHAELQLMAALYLAGADPRSPLASPLHGELAGLPPLLVQVGTAETLLADSHRLAARIQAAGGEVVLDEWPDMMHVWHAFAPLLPQATDAIARIGAWVRARLDR
jgi:monoterpene epsilon-lactone hydrolase